MKRWLKVLVDSVIEARLEAAKARVRGYHI